MSNIYENLEPNEMTSMLSENQLSSIGASDYPYRNEKADNTYSYYVLYNQIQFPNFTIEKTYNCSFRIEPYTLFLFMELQTKK